MPYLVMDEGSQIFYRQFNEGGKPVLLFCHGSGGNSFHWHFQFQGIDSRAMMVALDLPGHGNSGGRPLASITEYRDFLRAFAGKLGLAPFFLVGHSLGGAVALDYARTYPGDLAGIILICSGARLRVAPAILELFRKGNVSAGLTEINFGSDVEPSVREQILKDRAETPPEVFLADFEACDRFDLLGKLASIDVPTLVIGGSEDLLTPIKYAYYLKEHLPGAELAVVEGAGHMVIFEKPHAVNSAINSFINKPE